MTNSGEYSIIYQNVVAIVAVSQAAGQQSEQDTKSTHACVGSALVRVIVLTSRAHAGLGGAAGGCTQQIVWCTA